MTDRVVHHQVDIYGAWLHCTRSRKAWREMRKEIDRRLPKRVESYGLTSHVVTRDGTVHLCVFLDKRLDGAGLVEVSAHEAAHLAGMLLDGIEADYDGQSEPFAYLVGWATTWLWQVARGLDTRERSEKTAF